MKEITAALKDENPEIKVMVGGAVVTKEYAAKIGAYYSQNAVSAVKVARDLVK
jgi:5-methyltetrahydrofolate--homocysteine methyltransferase